MKRRGFLRSLLAGVPVVLSGALFAKAAVAKGASGKMVCGASRVILDRHSGMQVVENELQIGKCIGGKFTMTFSGNATPAIPYSGGPVNEKEIRDGLERAQRLNRKIPPFHQ